MKGLCPRILKFKMATLSERPLFSILTIILIFLTATLCLYTLSRYRPTLEAQNSRHNGNNNVSRRYKMALCIWMPGCALICNIILYIGEYSYICFLDLRIKIIILAIGMGCSDLRVYFQFRLPDWKVLPLEEINFLCKNFCNCKNLRTIP